MLRWLSEWAEGIIISVIIAGIIEMILPNGSSKKYIKVVIGIYILFTIVSPIITKFVGKTINVSDTIEIEKYIDEVEKNKISEDTLQKENYTSIRDIYIGNLKADIQNKLKGKGYNVTSIRLDIENDDSYTINKIILSVNKNEEENDKQEVEEDIDNVTQEVDDVNKINISVTSKKDEKIEEKENSNISNSEKKKIKEYLSNIYEIKEKDILIN